MKKVCFRLDSSVEIGMGHLVRCLTLAHELKKTGVSCFFACMELPGNGMAVIKSNHFSVFVLKSNDAEEFQSLLAGKDVDLLVVDHYQIGESWHVAVKPSVKKVMVIDDLANRFLQCDYLLDMGLGKVAFNYRGLIPDSCEMMLGEQYALLGEEFVFLRETAKIKRIEQRSLKNVLISLGSIDIHDLLPNMIQVLSSNVHFEYLHFLVVVSARTPNIDKIRQAVDQSSRFSLVEDSRTMAEHIVWADLGIGAAGITAYERCCLGLNSIVVPLMENQLHFALELQRQDLVTVIKNTSELVNCIAVKLSEFIQDIAFFNKKTMDCMALIDGLGARRVVKVLVNNHE